MTNKHACDREDQCEMDPDCLLYPACSLLEMDTPDE